MTPAIEPLGDCALLLHFGDRIDAELNAHALAVTAALQAANLRGILDVAPAYASVCLRYAPLVWSDPDDRRPAHERIAAAIRPLLDEVRAVTAETDAAFEVPVCYGGEFGPDLDEVARQARLAAHEVIARHAGADYRVAMLGFAPGFPYLFGLDARLHTPRRAQPRTRVPAGSVAIGGAQTGIYPRQLPGGWNVIGRTPLTLFDVARAPPALLAPGRRVRFRAIAADEFTALSP